MYLAIVTLVPGSGTDDIDINAQMLVDLLWAGALTTDRIEHISAAAFPDRIEFGIFLHAGDQLHADRLARSISDRACRTAPLLRGFRPS
ncbi:hypothetical protein KDK95_05375 [Actinospica sp. MGRD01-02]|uniref:Uncharacterized protein n=1 Tax=Actinospica acidithermotolerans TaxID=2828514 RepID=A0A941E8Z5_9ACTN|nr:hypothetical protein [Actinospica acidithermotolerans]MBR7825730.1 hypothetical protein [Actinospica acidithermotolerans]